jgi:PHP family Zn ribbon phosphoesterase
MIPPLIVEEALHLGINLLGITDHNATGNLLSMIKAAQGTGLTVLPGMELQTKEEVHLLCLFQELDDALAWGSFVSSRLPPLKNKPNFFGEQFIVDETGEYRSTEEQLLIVSADISLDDAVVEVHHRGGLAFPAHVDRKAFGLIANLGFLPPEIQVDALEISRRLSPQRAVQLYPQLNGYPLLQGGDAHRLDELLGANQLELATPTIQEIRLALSDPQGCKVQIVNPSS